MEAKAIVKKYNNYKQPGGGGGGLSPERAKVWTEKSPKYHQKIRNQQQNNNNNNGGKVAVVYYLCRNRQLEHPHFIEVPLSSPDGHLYLRDVIERLNVLRGRGMASMYSWSCKRSYKNGFVWHDLCEDDLILPAHGNEYVLKGSELFEDSSPGPFSPNANIRMPKPKSLPEARVSRCQDDTSSSSSLNDRTTKNSQEEELSPTIQYRGSSSVSPESSEGKNSSSNCNMMSLTEYKVYKSEGQTDAATQTDENGSSRSRETCTRGVSTDDVSSEHESSLTCENQLSKVKDTCEISQVSVSSPPPTASSATSSGARTDTLESLIRADASKFNNFRILEEDEFRPSSMSKFKASNMLLQLFSCGGSFSVKDRSFNLIPTYKPSFTSSRFPSPFFSSSFLLGEIDSMSENPRVIGVRLEDKEYFSGSLVETSILKDEGIRTLKRSSSYNADRTKKQNDREEEEDDEDRSTANSKCIPRSIKVSLTKQQPKSESQRSVSDGPRISSSDGLESSRITTSCASNGGSKRYANPNESSKDEKENVIKIEERLASGARVIIQSSEAFPEDDRNSSVKSLIRCV